MHKLISDKTKNLLVLYPYPIGKFIYQLYDFERLLDYYNVIIYDYSSLVAPGFSKYNDKHKIIRENIIRINSWFNSYKELIKLIKNHNLIILYELRNEKFGEFILRAIIKIYKKKYNIKIFCYVGGSLPDDEYRKSQSNILKMIVATIKVISSYEELIVILKRYLNKIICKVIKLEFDYILAGGEEWKKRYILKGKNTNIVDAHSHDFNKYLISKNEIITTGYQAINQAIFLDSGSPMFPGDYEHTKTKSLFTKEKWYPALCNFFSTCEEKLNLTIKIAAHYKTNHERYPDYFNNNEVIYGKTNDLIKNSKLVIALTSTAISYAVAYRKPVVFIYNNELINEYRTFNVIKSMSKSIGSKMINIDENLETYNFIELLNVDSYLYEQYEKQYLTCNRDGDINAVILKNLMC